MYDRATLLYGTNEHDVVNQLRLLRRSVVSDSATPWTVASPGSSVHGIVQARILERVAMPSSRGSSPPKDGTQVSCVGRWILYYRITREAPISSSTPHWSFAVNLISGGASQMVLVVKTLPANAGDVRDAGSIPGSGRSPGGGHGSALQCACLGESREQRSLADYGPRGRSESDATEATQHSCASFCRMRNRGARGWRNWFRSTQLWPRGSSALLDAL